MLRPLVVLITLASTAQADPAALLRQSLEASGGAAWQHVSSLHIHYALEQSGVHGVEDDYIDVRAGRYTSTTHLAPYTQREGFDGATVWTSTPDGFPYTHGDADSLLGAANNAYRNALAWGFPERHPATLADAGTRTESGRTFDLVSITPEGGRPFTLWIDHATHLVDRYVEQAAEDVHVVRYEDYRAYKGLRLPWTVRVGQDAVQHVQSVVLDESVSYSMPPRVEEPLPAPVTVPMRLVDNVVLVDVTIDGKGPYEADFDTGGELMLTPSVVSELKLPASGQWKQTGGGEGFVTATAGTLSEIAIGAAKVTRPVFTVHEFDSRAPKRILIGAEFLHRYVVRLDFERMTMTLTSPPRFEYRGAGAIVPFHFQSNQPEVYGVVDGIGGTFAVDTGDDGSLLLIAELARKYGLVERYHAQIPYGGSSIGATHGVYARVHSVELDGADGRPVVAVTQPVTRISTQTSGFDANRYVFANLGMGVLRQFDLTFDYARQRIVFEKNHFYGKPDVFNRSGMHLHKENDVWSISEVYAGQAADRAGLRAGDVIVRMGGKDASTLDGDTLRALTLGAIGTKVALVVRRGSTMLTRTLTLAEALVDPYANR